jgi:hypothetical protein
MKGTVPVLRRLGTEPATKRQVYLLPMDAITDFPQSFDLPGTRFVLLLAGDFDDPSLDLAGVARRIVDAGCAYFCAWGPACVLIHDEVDDAALAAHPLEDDESVLMTTWHDDEPLADAVVFAVGTAMPVGTYAIGCDATILAVSDRDSWLRDAKGAADKYLVQHAI